MSTGYETTAVLKQLRSNALDPAVVEHLISTPAGAFIADIRDAYPLLFQERTIGRKHEVGLARGVRYELSPHGLDDSLFSPVFLLPVLWKCVLVSSYDDVLSEITATASIRVRPVWEIPNTTVVKLGRGAKLDSTAEGWTVKPLRRRAATLSNEFLRQRGWKFDVLAPFMARRSS